MAQIKKTLIHETKPVTANAILTYTVPSFDTIDDIFLAFHNSGAASTKANIVAAIGKISLTINGEQVINTTAERLFDLYSFLGNEVNQSGRPANVLNLNVGRLLFLQPENEDFFAWGCSDINTIQVQVYCNGSVTGVTDCQVVTSRRPILTSLGSYIKVVSYPQSISAAGTSSVDTLPRDANEAYLVVMAAANTGGVISSGECVVNGINISDNVAADINAIDVCTRNLAPVSGYYSYIFADRSGRVFLPMLGVTELRLKTTFSTAPTGGVYDLLAVTIKNIPASMAAMYNSNAK